MRITITSADWPLSFNKFSKYLGRHWPKGKLKLNESREITATLLGYNSVHDVQAEIKAGASFGNVEDLTAHTMISAMVLRALVQYKIPPHSSLELFSKLPWKDLAIWEKTLERKTELSIKEYEDENENSFIIMDESHQLLNYSTPKTLIHQYDNETIPPYDYCVNKQGEIFRNSYFESLINQVEVSEDILKEVDIALSVDDFVEKHLIPLAWQTLENDLNEIEFDRSKGRYLAFRIPTPDMVTIKSIKGERWEVLHEGLNAHYTGEFNDSELKVLFKKIYMDTIQPTKTSLILKHYDALLDKPWIKDWWMPVRKPIGLIPKERVSLRIQHKHNLLQEWLSLTYNRSLLVINRCDIKKITDMLKPFFKGVRITLETLQEQGEYRPGDALDVDENIKKLKEEGKYIKQYHPDLAPYFDDLAIADIYEDFHDCNNYMYCNEREPGFVAFVFAKQLKQLYKKSFPHSKSIAALILADLTKDKLAIKTVKTAWNNSATLLMLHEKQNKILNDMSQYALDEENNDPRYLTHSAKTKLTRESYGEIIRKLNGAGSSFKPTAYSMTIEQIKKGSDQQ